MSPIRFYPRCRSHVFLSCSRIPSPVAPLYSRHQCHAIFSCCSMVFAGALTFLNWKMYRVFAGHAQTYTASYYRSRLGYYGFLTLMVGAVQLSLGKIRRLPGSLLYFLGLLSLFRKYSCASFQAQSCFPLETAKKRNNWRSLGPRYCGASAMVDKLLEMLLPNKVRQQRLRITS